MAPRAVDPRARVVVRDDCRSWHPAAETRVDEVRAAVRNLSCLGCHRRCCRGRSNHPLVFRPLRMTPAGQAFLGLTAIVAVLVGVLTFAVLKFLTATRQARGKVRESGMETAFLSAALHDAVAKLKAQERAMAHRAEASERLADQIIAHLTAGLLMVDDSGSVLIVNPAGRRLLGIGDGPHEGRPYREVLAHADPVAGLIEESLRTGRAIIRRAVEIPSGRAAATHL